MGVKAKVDCGAVLPQGHPTSTVDCPIGKMRVAWKNSPAIA